MKITYLFGSVGNTGGNIVLFQHMEALSQRGHTVIMLSPYSKKQWYPNDLKKVMSSQNVGYYGIWKTLRSIRHWMVKNVTGVEKILSRLYFKKTIHFSNWITVRLLSEWEQSDITIATHSYTAHAAALLANRTESYYHMQGYEPWFTDDIESKAVSLLSYSYPIKKIANCTWLHEKTQKLGNTDVKLVRPGLNHNIFKPLKKVQEKYSNFKEVHIVSYADHRPLKGWRESIEAMQVVFERFASNEDVTIKWSVFGSITNCKTSMPIEYYGYLSHQELAKLYSSAHIVFIPSWFESFPLQPLEAMACGTAICTTRIGTEDYAKNDETAVVIPPKDINALSDALISLITNPEKMYFLATNGIKEAKKFDWEQSANELVDALSLKGQSETSNLHSTI